MDIGLIWGTTLTLVVVGVCGIWFYVYGYADRTRRARPFARSTFFYAGLGFLSGLALVNSDFGSPPLGLVAFTACCGLLVYAAVWAAIASDDDSLVLVNLTGRALLLADPELAPFYTLPAPSDNLPTELPPVFPRTCYVVNAALGLLGAKAGRTDVFTVDASTAIDCGEAGLRVRKLVPAMKAFASRN